MAGNTTANLLQPDFIVLGPAGFLGASLVQSLERLGHAVLTTRLRLNDRSGIERLLDENPPSLGVICAAGERGRPNISWCDDHPVETMDANITGQLSLAALCHARGLHLVILGTGALYAADASSPSKRFTEDDPPNAKQNVYIALRQKLEELLAYFDNVLCLRVLYPLSSDLDPRGLLGKLARFPRVDRVQTSVTILEDLWPLVPELVRRRTTGPLNFVNDGVAGYADIISDLQTRAPTEWKSPEVAQAGGAARPSCELDVARLSEKSGKPVPSAAESIRRIIGSLSSDELATLLPGSKL